MASAAGTYRPAAPPPVLGCADHQYGLRRFQLPFGPLGPLRRVVFHVLIDPGVYPVRAEAVAQLPHAPLMLRRIVRVYDKDLLRGIRGRHRYVPPTILRPRQRFARGSFVEASPRPGVLHSGWGRRCCRRPLDAWRRPTRRAGPRPPFCAIYQSGRYGIPLHIFHNPLEILLVSNPVVEEFILPERHPGRPRIWFERLAVVHFSQRMISEKTHCGVITT